MKRIWITGILLLAMGFQPMQASWKTAWKAGLATLAASTAMDCMSSRGAIEMNPVLGRGQFGARQIGIKIGLVSGIAIGQWLIVRHHPKQAKALAISDFAISGVTMGVARHNWGLK